MPTAFRSLSQEEAALLLKLYRGRKFGSSHLLEDNLLKGFPADRLDAFRRSMERLKGDGILQRKATEHGLAVSIPPSLGKEIYEELRKRYTWLPKPPWR